MYSQDKGTPIGYNVSISNFLLRWMQLLVNLKQWAGFQCLPPSYKVMGDQVPGGDPEERWPRPRDTHPHTQTHSHSPLTHTAHNATREGAPALLTGRG